jgi:KDO2-lipid IV(A) lauroyltransferase
MLVHKVVLQAVLPVLRRSPYRLAHGFLSVMGRLDLIVVPQQAKRYRAAVAAGGERLGCDWDAGKVSRALARQTYRWRTRDFLLDGRPDHRVGSLFRVSGRDRLDAALARRKGVILLANHFGSHVLMTHWLFRQGYPVRWLGEKPRNVSGYLARQFATDGPLGQEALFVSRNAGPAESASTIHHASKILGAGLIIKAASDVRWRDAKAARATFLGRTESFSTTWVTLAALTGAAVVPAFCRMGEDGTFHLEFQDAFHLPPDARREGRAAAWVQRALDLLEDQVRRFPEQSNDYFFWDFEEEFEKRSRAIKPLPFAAGEPALR